MPFPENLHAAIWRSPEGPGVSVPPTAIFLLAFAGAYLLHLVWPSSGPWSSPVAWWTGVALLTAGAALFLWALWTFATERTGIMLQRAASHVVRKGPYRWSRNPMYVSFVALYLGAALMTGSSWSLLLMPLPVLGTQKLVIAREERYMRSMFPIEYGAYCREVRRWL
jgi:protein-S-isoprenylcysteine O-methyltransferase Ste14